MKFHLHQTLGEWLFRLIAPAEGEAPIARNSVTRRVGVAIDAQVTVVISTKVRPLPLSVGAADGGFAFELITATSTRALALGVIDAVS